MEYIDVVTETGESTGKAVTRDEVHRLGLLHRTVHIWIINDKKEILLQKRAKTKETHPGMWDISCAGHISAGETAVEAALKELKEELGVAASESDLKPLFTLKTEFSHHDGFYIDREIHDTFILTLPVDLADIILQSEEVESVRFFSPDTFKDMFVKKDPLLVAHYEEYRLLSEVLEL